MKLYLNETSPFARWILVCALEWAVDFQLVWVNPWELPDELRSINPFSTVPVLQTDAGQVLYESSLIVQYLLPSAPIALATLQRLALGKMLLETAFRYVSWQRYSPTDGPVHPLIGRSYQTLERVLRGLVAEDLPIVGAGALPDVASLQLAVGLDYLEFRCPSLITACLGQPLQARWLSYQGRSSFRRTTPSLLAQQPGSICEGRLRSDSGRTPNPQ